jgi:hypothetical protein
MPWTSRRSSASCWKRDGRSTRKTWRTSRPYLTEHINRFGEYSTHELGIQPEAYDPKLDVDFTPLREQDLTAVGLGQAA